MSFHPRDAPAFPPRPRAADAFERCGRSTGHPARLEFGDCASSAMAMGLDAPLLFKGANFAHTGVKRAI